MEVPCRTEYSEPSTNCHLNRPSIYGNSLQDQIFSAVNELPYIEVPYMTEYLNCGPDHYYDHFYMQASIIQTIHSCLCVLSNIHITPG